MKGQVSGKYVHAPAGYICGSVAGCSYLIYSRERRAGWGKGVVDEEKECLLWSQRHTLAYQEAQLPNLKEEGARKRVRWFDKGKSDETSNCGK